MKSKITEIINQVSNRTISTDEAIDEILHLFSVSRYEGCERGITVCEYEQKKHHINDGRCAKCNDYKHNHKAN